MNTEKIISLLRCAIDVADAAFSYDEYIAMCNFLDRLERLGNVLDEDDRPFPKIVQTKQLKHEKGD